jgi:hypothetical protein
MAALKVSALLLINSDRSRAAIGVHANSRGLRCLAIGLYAGVRQLDVDTSFRDEAGGEYEENQSSNRMSMNDTTLISIVIAL